VLFSCKRAIRPLIKEPGMIKRLFSIAGIGIVMLALHAFSGSYAIEKVRVSEIPAVKNFKITYTLDMKFNQRPEEYWAFYDTVKKAIVIDFYNISIDTGIITLRKNNVFKSISIINQKTAMALSGERAQIQIPSDPGWHVETASLDSTIIRVTVWRPMSRTGKNKLSRPWIRFLYLCIPLAVGIVVFIFERSSNK
jgi:hypothetical protein